jgi:RNA polymerase sigma-70 factor (ECF subfamily)
LADDEIDRVRQLDGALVLEALGAVAEAFRAPLTLFYLEDLSYQEIAETLGVPVGTVMSRLSRGKDQLRAALAAQAQSPQIVPFPAAQRRPSP